MALSACFGPFPPDLKKLYFEIQLIGESAGLFGPVRPHDRLLSFTKVVIWSLAVKYALNVAHTRSRRRLELAPNSGPMIELLCRAPACDDAY